MNTDDDVYDVAVVGAGIMGLSAASHLASQQYKTILFEQFSLFHALGSSHGFTRIIRYAHEEEFYVKMMIEAFAMWEELEKQFEEPLFIRNGYLHISTVNSPVLKRIRETLNKFNLTFENYSHEKLAEFFPMYEHQNRTEGLLDKSGGILLADKCSKAFLKSYLANGGVVKEQDEVLNIDADSPNDVVIKAKSGVYKARKVIITTGSWSCKLLNDLNCYVPLQPVNVTAYYWREKVPGTYDYRHVPVMASDTIFPGELYTSFVPFCAHPNLVKGLIGDGPKINADAANIRDVNGQYLKLLCNYIKANIPYLHGDKPFSKHDCIYTNTPDKNFIIDKHPTTENIIIGGGFSGRGFKFAPVVGKILANLATDKDPGYDLTPFSIQRFTPKSCL